MTKNNRFSLASEKGHFDGLVDDGKYSRQSLLFKQILQRTQSWLKICVNPPHLRLKIRVHSWVINTQYLLRILTYEIINLFLQNEPNFRKSQMNVTDLLKRNYEQMDTWLIRKNEPKTNPKRTQIEPKLKKAKMNANSIITKDYENISNWAICENETKTKPIYLGVASGEAGTNPISRAKNSCARLWPLLQCFSENFDKPGERKAEYSARPKLRINPMNLLGTMPAKGGKIDLKHSFCGSAFCFEFSVTEPRP